MGKFNLSSAERAVATREEGNGKFAEFATSLGLKTKVNLNQESYAKVDGDTVTIVSSPMAPDQLLSHLCLGEGGIMQNAALAANVAKCEAKSGTLIIPVKNKKYDYLLIGYAKITLKMGEKITDQTFEKKLFISNKLPGNLGPDEWLDLNDFKRFGGENIVSGLQIDTTCEIANIYQAIAQGLDFETVSSEDQTGDNVTFMTMDVLADITNLTISRFNTSKRAPVNDGDDISYIADADLAAAIKDNPENLDDVDYTTSTPTSVVSSGVDSTDANPFASVLSSVTAPLQAGRDEEQADTDAKKQAEADLAKNSSFEAKPEVANDNTGSAIAVNPADPSSSKTDYAKYKFVGLACLGICVAVACILVGLDAGDVIDLSPSSTGADSVGNIFSTDYANAGAAANASNVDTPAVATRMAMRA